MEARKLCTWDPLSLMDVLIYLLDLLNCLEMTMRNASLWLLEQLQALVLILGLLSVEHFLPMRSLSQAPFGLFRSIGGFSLVQPSVPSLPISVSKCMQATFP